MPLIELEEKLVEGAKKMKTDGLNEIIAKYTGLSVDEIINIIFMFFCT